MPFSIRKYNETDRPELLRLMEELQDYVTGVDPLKRVERREGFGEAYTEWLLGVIAEADGVIYLAERDGKIVGCSAGIMPKQPLHDVLAGVPSKFGRVQEMYVDEKFRGEGIGKVLIEKCEVYFKQNGCDVALVEVFAPNKSAYEFYRACGYADRDINLMKKL